MPNELMIEEYKSLRSELLQHSANVSRWQIIGFLSAGLAIVVAFIGLNNQAIQIGSAGAVVTGPLIAAGALVVIAGCVSAIVHDLTAAQRIAAYMQVFLEGYDTGALWETRTENAPEVYRNLPLAAKMMPFTALMSAGMICALISGVLPLFLSPLFFSKLPYWLLLIPVVWIAFWLVMLPGFRACNQDNFKSQARRAYYESLKRPPKEESGPR